MQEQAKKQILVVDDDVDFIEHTRSQLERAGYLVLSAASLAEADAVLAEHKPDLVIADLMMEYMDAGLVLCHRVKKKDPKTPVILVTAYTSQSGMSLEANLGEGLSWVKADGVLTKPLRAEQIQGEIDRLL